MKKILALTLSLILVLAMATTSASAATVMKYAVTFPNAGTQAEGAEKLAELIEQYSEGRIDVEVYYSSQLGGNTESMEGLRMGTIEATELSLTAISAYSDIWSTFSLPYLWQSGDEAIKVLSSEKVMELLEKDLEENGMKVIAWQKLGARSILNTKKAINTHADMKGLRIRVIQDPVLVDSINAMGGAAIAMAWSECYSGLEQGTIDGVENVPPVITANAMQEVGKFYSLTEQFIMPDPVLVSLSWFESLSAEDQEAVVKAGEEYARLWNDEIWPGAEDIAIAEIEAAGCAVNEVDKAAFVEATQSVRDNFIKNATPEQVELYNLLMEVRDAE